MIARLFFLSLLSSFLLVAPVGAQQPDDDDDKDEPAQPNGVVVMQNNFTDETFEQWVFQNNGRYNGARQQLGLQLLLQIEDLDRTCKLTDLQKKKLQMTGQGDIKRFFDKYDKVKKKFDLLKNDQQKLFQEIWQDINPLQLILQSGLFLEDSILYKSLHNTLTPEQWKKYREHARERREFQHRYNIEFAVAMIEMNTPLRASQRRELMAALSTITKAPRRTGQYGYYVVMYQMAHTPEEKLKPLFDDIQWKALKATFQQYQGMRQWLKDSGQLPDEDDDAKADARP
jgi:hypothetical protein